ncbi:MAG: pseudouridylate synthase [Deltaproteobacteria bacterium]|nr:pseudouridylate synthase [Deltaproteobacteria bacterium]
MSEPLPLLWCDEDLVVVDKPSGMLVHRGWDRDPVVAMTAVRDQLGRHVFPVHRLDRGTSGVLAFALSSEMAAPLHRQFEEGAVRKVYLALVRGVPPEQGVIDHPVPRAEEGPKVEAVTEYRRLFAGERFSLVEAMPRTGRLHQIRRHLKHLGHPLVGDVNYGRGEINRLFRERYGLRRLALHARSLELGHPRTGERLRFQAPVPADLCGALRELGCPEGHWARA